jgi:hypothetical protein
MAAPKNKDNPMYSLTIHFGPNAIQWQFLFKDHEDALAAYDKTFAETELVWIADSFGQRGMFRVASISGVLLEDINAMEEARIERSLADARASTKLQGRARTDPTIRAAQQGAPVLTPMGGGFRQ